MYCKKCGGKLESYASNCAFCGTPVEKYDTKVNYVKPEQKEVRDYRPMTAKKWIGLTFLNVIPLIGNIIYLILMFKWAFGSTKDLTLKDFARATLFFILLAILAIVALVIFVYQNQQLVLDLLEKLSNLLEKLPKK